MRINYSTAKTFMRKYYKYGYDIDEPFVESIVHWYGVYASEKSHQLQRCGYRCISVPSSSSSSSSNESPPPAKE